MRFRLKTEYTQFVRDQVRGGLWFAPSWWNALSKVPPAHFQPVVPKSRVPRITFLEDQLKREFHQRNPVVAVLDRGQPGRPNATVAAAFVARQVDAMRGASKSKKEAYDVAMAWMFENGNSTRLLQSLNLPPKTAAILALKPSDVPRAREVAAAALEAQVEQVRRLLASATSEEGQEGGRGVLHAGYRSFMDENSAAAVSGRVLSSDAAIPTHLVDEAERAGGEGKGKGGGAPGAGGKGASKDILSSQGMEQEVADKVLAGGPAPPPAGSPPASPSAPRKAQGGAAPLRAGDATAVPAQSPKGQGKGGKGKPLPPQ